MAFALLLSKSLASMVSDHAAKADFHAFVTTFGEPDRFAA